MCGIAGIVTAPHFALPNLTERLSAMSGAMLHRGPDDGGCTLSADGRVGLANRRLAVRDLSPLGHMPMSNADGSICITYNGEIYNTDALRPQLEAEGYRFKSSSDTEVILYGYQAWGTGVLARLEGMFAFAIYDCRETPRLVLARDQMGIKPLYYAFTSDALVFASELKTLLTSGLISQEIDPAGLVAYLRMGSVPNPLTIYRDITALEPASTFTFFPDRWAAPQPTSYWSLPISIHDQAGRRQPAEEIEQRLAEAVRIRLVSDVPLGAFLSGGLDSSAVVGLMRKATTGAIRTCSMVFHEAEYSEAAYARAMADSVGAEHFERVITAADVVSEFDHILSAMDQPSVDGVNTYFVSQTARQAGLTVALSGLGGDELFGGYPNTFGDVPRMLRGLRFAHMIPGGVSLARAALKVADRPGWDRVGDALAYPPSLASAYLTRRGLFSAADVQKLVSPDIWAAAGDRFDPVQHVSQRANANGTQDAFSWVSRAELRTYTHHQLLRDTDVMSMAHSLEVRVPFFDTQLIEAALQLPALAKSGDDGRPKPLLAEAIKRYVPASILERKDKQGFTFPFDVWLRGVLRARVEELVTESVDSKLLRKEAADTLVSRFDSRQVHWSRLWALATISSASLQ